MPSTGCLLFVFSLLRLSPHDAIPGDLLRCGSRTCVLHQPFPRGLHEKTTCIFRYGCGQRVRNTWAHSSVSPYMCTPPPRRQRGRRRLRSNLSQAREEHLPQKPWLRHSLHQVLPSLSNEASAYAEAIADLASATANTPLPPNTAITIVYILGRGTERKITMSAGQDL